jgi:NADH dehydrogenase
MRGLVTIFGGSGFVGGQIVRALAKQGWRIRVAVRRPWQAYRLRLLGDVGQIEIVQANVRVPETVDRALEGAEAAIYSIGVLFEAGKQTFQSTQVDGPRTVAQAAARQGVERFVLISAIGADPNSASKYARAKAEGEAAVWAALPGAVILRPSIVFGPDDAFFNRFGAMAAMSPALPLIGGGETRLQPVFVADVARAAASALDPVHAGRTFELGGPSVYTFKELMQLVLSVTGRKRALVPIPWPLAGLMGAAGDVAGALHGAVALLPPPPITTDQVILLKSDNVVGPGALGLADLGVTQPIAVEPTIPTYLYRYRKGGQYADLEPPADLVRA